MNLSKTQIPVGTSESVKVTVTGTNLDIRGETKIRLLKEGTVLAEITANGGDAKHVAFRLQMQRKAESFLVDYKDKTPPEELHLKNIAALKALSKELGNELTVGTVQKLFNLLCKYYWCAGFIQVPPPHLPIDRIMLQSIKSKQAWTKLDSMDEYKEIIAAFKKKSKEDGFDSLAQWELSVWNAAEKQEEDIE